MKIRSGFVSNSSSSSFCIYGASLEIEDLEQFAPEGTNFEDEDEESWAYEVDFEDIEEAVLEKMGEGWTFFYEGECMEEFYVGKSLEALGDNETGKQFKDSIEEKIHEVFGEEYVCRHIEETITS